MRTLKELFDARLLITPGCWIWQGTVTKSKGYLPYGRLKYQGKQLLAHRVSYELHIGAIPKDSFVLHRCDNATCANPDHLFLGTHDENMADKVQKDRQARGVGITGNRNSASGERHGRALLTTNDVLEIRRISSIGHRYGRAELASRYGVSEATIKAIKSRKIWKNI